MGCDIHIWAEKKNPVTHNWDKMGKVFFESYGASLIVKHLVNNMGITEDEGWIILKKWRDGEEPSNKLEEYIIGNYIPKNMSDEHLHWYEANEKGLLPYPYSDQPYGGRCYRLFGALAGVRDTSIDMIVPGRYGQLPDDVSVELEDMSDDFGVDAHSHSYLTLRELIDSKYYKMSAEELYDMGIDAYFFKTMVPDLQKFGNPDDIRIVYWFDN
jgi:hypothetical protein